MNTSGPPNFTSIAIHAGSVFTPGSPINEFDLFAGRLEQIRTLLDALSQRGYHAVLYGERGVGKTSLANRVTAFFQAGTTTFVVPRVNCDATDNFDSIWRKAFGGILTSSLHRGAGFTAEQHIVRTRVVERLPNKISPDDVRKTLDDLSAGLTVLIIFDEFDRLQDRKVTVQMADTIKSLSDYGVGASILLIGVADSVGELIEGHQSIERALVQIPMPRMSMIEIRQIVNQGLTRLNMTADSDAIENMAALSQGLPYITHLLALQGVRSALAAESLNVNASHVEVGIKRAMEQWQESTKAAYYAAIRSQQPGNIYREVLLACALAETDELGYFAAAAVRPPLRKLTGRSYDIPNFARHLKEFSESTRGGILQRVGQTRRLRYRFVSPIMRPYIVMRGYSESALSKSTLQSLLLPSYS